MKHLVLGLIFLSLSGCSRSMQIDYDAPQYSHVAEGARGYRQFKWTSGKGNRLSRGLQRYLSPIRKYLAMLGFHWEVRTRWRLLK